MKTPDAIGGTDAQQQEYAAKVRTIRADQLSDAHMGRLVSLAGHPPRRLWRSYQGLQYPPPDHRETRVVCLRWDANTETAVMPDAEITIHPES